LAYRERQKVSDHRDIHSTDISTHCKSERIYHISLSLHTNDSAHSFRVYISSADTNKSRNCVSLSALTRNSFQNRKTFAHTFCALLFIKIRSLGSTSSLFNKKKKEKKRFIFVALFLHIFFESFFRLNLFCLLSSWV
jgi:hypothetical protein